MNDHDTGAKAESPKCMRPFTFSKAMDWSWIGVFTRSILTDFFDSPALEI